jgi:DNA-binding transcriptional LysR family regulator
MPLSRIDLNLFTVFDVIYREGGITPASRRLHLSQPAVSHALARLRELFQDPLFERRGHEMVPTPLARSIAATVTRSLGELEMLQQRAGRFDPSTSERTLSIGVRESHEPVLLPALLACLGQSAPGIDIAAVRIDRRDLEDDLESGAIDLALDVALPLSAEVRRERVSADRLAVLARTDHPTVRGAVDIETYLAMEHVLVTGRRRGGGYEDLALGRLGLARRIRVRCQGPAAAAGIVCSTDLLVTLPQPQAELAYREAQHQLLPFPLEVPPLELYLYWHANVEEDPASRWFRQRMLEELRR